MKNQIAIAPGVFAHEPYDSIKEKFRRLDLAVSDLDQCLFPGFTQIALTKSMFLTLLRKPELARNLNVKLKIANAALFTIKVKFKSLLKINTEHIDMIKKYEKVVEKIPREYFLRAAEELPAGSYRYGFDTLHLLSKRMPVGIITLGLDVIMREFVRQFARHNKSFISFYNANKVLFNTGNGTRVFDRYSGRKFMATAKDKSNALTARLKQFNVGHPLVIGHNAFEVDMARSAKEMGGLSVAFNPDKTFENEFDIIVRGKNWEPMFRFFKSLQNQ